MEKDTAGCRAFHRKSIVIGVNKMGFFAMIASMLLGILFVVIGISRRKQKGWPIILIALGIVFVLIAVYLGFPK